MKPRITMSLTRDGEFQIHLSEAGRQLLVQDLSKESDHFHLGPEDYAEVQVSTRAYETTDTVFRYGKMLFRPDEWDREYLLTSSLFG